MGWRGLAVVAALALSSCTFSSEQPLFADSEAATPFGDGALYDWKPSDESGNLVVRFTRVGGGYELNQVNTNGEKPMQVLFVDVPETPEDDYIAQIAIDTDRREGFAYAYLWPTGGDSYRVYSQPNAFDDGGETYRTGGYCAPADYNGCTFTRGEDVRRYYRDVLYPAFRSGHIPASYLDLTPAAGPAPARRL